MKRDEENFDDFLKRKLPSEQVPFNEKYWQNARNMLDQNRPQRKRYGFVLFMSALFFVAISAVLFNRQNNKASFTTAQSEAHPEEAISPAILSPAEHAGIITDVLSETSSTAAASSLPVSTQNNSSKAQDQKRETEKDLLHQSVSPAQSSRTLTNRTKTSNQPDRNEDAGDMQSGEQNMANQETENKVSDLDMPVVSNQPLFATLVEPPRWKTELETESYSPKALAGSGFSKQRSVPYKMIEAGINYYNPASDITANLNVHFGLKYCFSIAPRLSIVTGLSYSRQHQDKGKRTYNTISYGFGENRKTTGINTIRLDYVEVPLSLFYSVKGRHGLMAGFSCNYLVQSADLIKKANEMSYKEKSSGHYAAFNRFDVQLHAGYTYTLNSRILISAAYYGGITDVTKNKAFRSNEFNTNKGLRLTFGYQLY